MTDPNDIKRQDAAAAFEAALAGLDRLLVLEPAHQWARTHRAALLCAAGRVAEAVADFTAVLGLHPDDVAALAGRGGAFWMLDRLDAAAADLDRALVLDPGHVSALVDRANVFQEQYRYAEALALYDRALALRSDDPAALANRGATLREMGRYADALDACRHAHAVRPEDADTALNLAMCLLQMGIWQEGWATYEARLRRPPWSEAMAGFTAPQWDGRADLAGKLVLLVGEQGLGDTIQFCRFAHRVADRGATVILGVEPPLRRLMTGLDGVAAVAVPGDADPDYDFFCPLMSLPVRLGLTPADVGMAPYLRADAACVAAWRLRLAVLPGLKVGLVWAGERRAHDRMALRTDRRRSVALERLAPLFDVPGVTFVSLQKGAAGGQAVGWPVVDWTAELEDFADTTALIAALDLVISVDTSVAHAAGALGRPVWVLNRFDRCWRWLADRTDSPWYPTMRLFTQATPGVWDDVVAAVAAALGQAASGTVQAS
ncbi:MAG TPA: tetratricopeptide repeat protein [Rhodopila sp.]|nr:tetratricopeptide repeat protein [Rhodopila sp.]